MNVLVLGELGAGILRLDAEGVGTKVVTLSLEQVGGEVSGAVSIVEAQSRAESGGRDTPESTLADDVSPAILGLVNRLVEEIIEEQVLQVRVVAVGTGNVLQKDRPDNATTAPHESDGGLVQLPAVLLGSLREG